MRFLSIESVHNWFQNIQWLIFEHSLQKNHAGFTFENFRSKTGMGVCAKKKSQALDMWVSMGTKSVKIKNHKRSAKGSH